MPKIDQKPAVARTQPQDNKALAQQAFGAAIAAKRGGDLNGAIKLLDAALEKDPGNAGMEIARAGYQHLQGDAEGARSRFDAIAVPGPAEGPVNLEAFDYFMNAAWFHGLTGDNAGVLASVEKLLEQAPKADAQRVFSGYLAEEPDLAHMRTNAKLLTLLGRAPEVAPEGFDAKPRADADVAADFVASQSKPSVGQSPLNARLAAATQAPVDAKKSAALAAAVRGLRPLAQQGTEAKLTALITRQIDKAVAEGERFAELKPGQLDKLVEGSGAYGALKDKLEAAGYPAMADGFIGVSIDLKALEVSGDKDAALGALRALTPPAAADSTDQLVGLIEMAIARATTRGESSGRLEPSELDPVLKPLGMKYGELKEVLEQAGFDAWADGFVGVSLSWPEGEASGKLDKDAIAALELPAAAKLDAGARLVDLVEGPITDAAAHGKTEVELDYGAIDRVAQRLGADLDEVTAALEQAGFKVFADGFADLLSLRWGD